MRRFWESWKSINLKIKLKFWFFFIVKKKRFRDRKFLTFEILEEIEHFEVCKELYDEEAIIDEIYQELSNCVLKEVEKVENFILFIFR